MSAEETFQFLTVLLIVLFLVVLLQRSKNNRFWRAFSTESQRLNETMQERQKEALEELKITNATLKEISQKLDKK